jgi:hypothetical protein
VSVTVASASRLTSSYLVKKKKKKKKKEGVDFKAERWIRAAKPAKPQRRAAQVSPALKELQAREAEP